MGLNNCVQVDAMGNMGADQLAWLKSDPLVESLSHRRAPIVFLQHISHCGWSTRSGAGARTETLVKRMPNLLCEAKPKGGTTASTKKNDP